MITGTFSLSSDVGEGGFAPEVSLFATGDDLLFRPVGVKNFTGGYFFHPALPCSHDDFYYVNTDDDILVLLSGFIYNKEELQPGHYGNGKSSVPGLIASLFLGEGPAFAKRINGDFAIFIWRPEKREAYIFRDHLGIRPLAWSRAGETVHFSSDINTLCKVLAEGQPADEEFLLEYFKYTNLRTTPNHSVCKLLPGHYICFTGNETKIIRYWHPEKKRMNSKLSVDQVFSELRSLLTDAVKIRCDRRFNAGAHVSGGLDSGIIAALARGFYENQEKFYGFSWSPEDHDPDEVKYDERNLVRSTCTLAGMEPVFSEVRPEDLISDQAGHSGSPWLLYEKGTREQAARYGVNLILSGWGGDEFISTGDRGIEQDLLRRFRVRLFFRRNAIWPFRKFIRNQLLFVVFPALGILDRATASSFRDDARYLKERHKKSDPKALSDFYFHRSRREMHLKMLRFYHLPKRCEEWMINGYRRGIEYRYPLLDRRIVEYMLTVPTEVLARAGEYRPLLRELGRSLLPEDVRLSYSKNDPVSRSYLSKLSRDAAMMLTDETEKWRSNPDLSFIDFDILSEDIRLLREKCGKEDDHVLYKGLVNIKAVHEFTRQYRKN